MKKEFLDLKKMTNAILRHERGETEREVMSPEREWVLGIAMTAVFVLIGMFVSYRLYIIDPIADLTVDPASPTVQYNAGMVEAVEQMYQNRAKQFNQWRDSATASVELTESETDVPVETIIDESADQSVNTDSTSSDNQTEDTVNESVQIAI